jgi:hypothetical protein
MTRRVLGNLLVVLLCAATVVALNRGWVGLDWGSGILSGLIVTLLSQLAPTVDRLREDQAHRLKVLEQENARLKRIVAEQESAISTLRDLDPGKF